MQSIKINLSWEAARFSDKDYKNAGVKVLNSAASLYKEVDIVAKVRLSIVHAFIKSKQIPALSGSQGPGEIIIPSGFNASAPGTVILSFRTTFTSAPSCPRKCQRLYVKLS